MDKNPKRALGRGLDALLPQAPTKSIASYGDKSVFSCPIEKLIAQKGQPRQYFEPQALAELAASIKEHGLLEPIVVRRAPQAPDKFEIIAGERRYRAAQKAGLHEVLVVVKDVSPKAAFELALIENVQREDLNPVELAEALDRLVKEHGYSHDTLGDRLKKDRSTIVNSLRLLKLPPRVRAKVIDGELSEGHARALLGAGDARQIEDLAERVLRGKLNVRATEELVRGKKPAKNGAANKDKPKSASVRDLEARLTRKLGARVLVRDKNGAGEIAIPYANLDALDRLLAKLL
jgi:ParB family chromosome partitioning protein